MTTRIALLLVGCGLLTAGFLPVEPRTDPDLLEMERATLSSVNRIRDEHGLDALSKNDVLTRIARSHSEDMARRVYFAHESPEGAVPVERLVRNGLVYARVGENLHRSRGMEDPVRTAILAWLESDGHRAIMLAPDFRESGVGIATDGEGMLYFTQLFLAPPE